MKLLQILKHSTAKRIAACIMAVAVGAMPVCAVAEDSAVFSETEVAESEALLENEEQTFAASSLLVTGGHKTYLSGVKGGYFLPNKQMTRAEVAQMLYNLLAAKPAVSTSQFSDVSLDSWYGTAVNALAKVGVLSGYKDGTFSPTKTISRAEFVCALTRCFTLESGTADFTDVPETHWAYKYIAAASNAGWISGPGDGTFCPDRGIMRCEAVTVTNLALGRTGDGFAADSDTQKFKDVPKTHWAYKQIAEAAAPVEDTTTPEPEPEEPAADGDFTVGQTVQVSVASGLNMRSSPETSASAVARLSKGTVLTITDVSCYPWLGAKTTDGKTGYVYSGYDDGWYVTAYTPSASVSGLSLSASELTVKQYQSARLDAAVSTGSLKTLTWSSSDPNVAVVGYTVGYGSGETQQGAFIYAKKQGTATLTLSDAAGNTKASCTVTVAAAESVRYAYSSENTAVKGETFNLIAVTDAGRSSVEFKIVSGPTSGSYTTTQYSTEKRDSSYGLPTNNVRVFKKSVSFNATGVYTIRASANNFADYQEFELLVRPEGESVTATSFNERRTSTEGIDIIANYEGAVAEIADDNIAAGNPTVGYGLVVQKNKCFYNNMTPSEMRGQLVTTVNSGGYADAVNTFRTKNSLKMSQAQFDALVSFVYNCGTGTLFDGYDTFKVMLNAVQIPSGGISESKSYPGIVNVAQNDYDTCTIYADHSLSAKSVGNVPEKASLTVIGTYADEEKCQRWYKVTYGSYTGWVPAGYIQLNTSGLVHDLACADATALSNNYMLWHKSGGSHIAGLLYRRMAECKIFFFGDYADASHSSSTYKVNNRGFNPPSCCASYVN